MENSVKEIFRLIEKEDKRQQFGINLIASENLVSRDVMKASGSCLTNKYAEGYPYNRYYGGCVNVDDIESLTIELVSKLFNCRFANVQPHCGSSANMAVYKALLQPNDLVYSMSLSEGGHLTHGAKVSFSGKDYNFQHYPLTADGIIDYVELEKMCENQIPKMIIAGGSAYSRLIDFERIRKLCDKYKILFMVDMAHFAGLVAAKLIPNPCDYADVVTSTTHKTLRGPRGGLILTNNDEIFKKINKTIFPGIQGGPLMNIIAAKGVAFAEALQPEFKEYQKFVVNTMKFMAITFEDLGVKVISGGTDTHLLLLDVKNSFGLTGQKAESILSYCGIIVNKNTIPGETESPIVTSGIRIGVPAFISLLERKIGLESLSANIIGTNLASIIYLILKYYNEKTGRIELHFNKEGYDSTINIIDSLIFLGKLKELID